MQQIRMAKPQDLPIIQQLNFASFENDLKNDSRLIMSWPFDDALGGAYFASRVKGEDASICFVAEIDDQIVGYIAGSMCPNATYRTAVRSELENMFVMPEARRQGVGRQLVDELKKWSLQNGSDEIYVSAYYDNQRAVNFYKSCGFKSYAHDLLLDLHSQYPTTSARKSIFMLPVTDQNESACLEAHEIMQHDNFSFLLRYDNEEPWSKYVSHCRDQAMGINIPDGWVQSTFLLVFRNNVLVGRTSIRHQLNDYLLKFGGHIGYGVLPEFRRQGIATQILQQSLVIARSFGISDVLVTCDEDNIASVKTIERCGGTFESLVEEPGNAMTRRYWISTR